MVKTLYTLGYTGRTPEAFETAGKVYDAVIADIRLSPTSRAHKWQGYALRVFLESKGVEYVHMPDLGNIHYLSPAKGVELRDETRGARELYELLQRRSVLLMCACADLHSCHRIYVARIMAKRFGVQVYHLDGTDRQSEAPADQMGLF